MVMRMAGVGRVGAISVDYPGSLLDVRHLVDDDVHEVVRSLSLGEAMGYRLPAGDDGALRVDLEAAPDAAATAEQSAAVTPSRPRAMWSFIPGRRSPPGPGRRRATPQTVEKLAAPVGRWWSPAARANRRSPRSSPAAAVPTSAAGSTSPAWAG